MITILVGQVPFTSINMGTCTSLAGRIVINSILDAEIDGLGDHETPIFPIVVFKVRAGKNRYSGDPNYDLYLKAIESTSKRMYPNYVNCDASFNAPLIDDDDIDTEAATMGCRTRVMSDIFGWKGVSGKGNISPCTINLPLIAVKHGICLGERTEADIKGFYNELDEMLDFTLEQLVYRFEYQGKQIAMSSDFMMREGTWRYGKTLRPDQPIKELLKHGSLAIGFCGLAETLVALYGKHHGEDKEVWKAGYNIVKYIRDYCDRKTKELQLNITCYATPAESTCGKFRNAIYKKYGKIEGVSDREYITNSFHIPVWFKITAKEKIELEAPFHKLCNAGHISYVELDGNARNNPAAIHSIIDYALDMDMGYVSVNFNLDRCPRCGYEGIIGNECPKCLAKDNVDVHISRIRRVTGYLNGDYTVRFNPFKQAEVRDRIKHM